MPKNRVILIRAETDMKDSIAKAAMAESKSVSQYLQDLHIEHLITRHAQFIHCKHCSQYAKREFVKCWNCKNKI